MKLREYIKYLQNFDEELEVIMSKDSEGNGYTPFYKASVSNYVATNSYSGEFEEDREGANALCLYGVN